MKAHRGMPAWERYLGLPLLRAHDVIYRRTGGLVGHHLPGAPPSLLLHTVGAKTGAARTTSLSYARDGADYLVVASKGGAPTAPGWLFNLRARPGASINLGRRRLAVTARFVGADDPDRARLWKLVNDNNAGRYDAYQKRTTRTIPIVALTPTS